MYLKCIELSKYIWSLKNHGTTPIVKWGIVKKLTVNFHRITSDYPQRKTFYH